MRSTETPESRTELLTALGSAGPPAPDSGWDHAFKTHRTWGGPGRELVCPVLSRAVRAPDAGILTWSTMGALLPYSYRRAAGATQGAQ